MRLLTLPTLAVAALASFASPSFAGDPYYVPPPALLEPPAVLPPEGPNPTNPGLYYVQPDGSGQFDCQLGERRTRLQKQACGPLKPEY